MISIVYWFLIHDEYHSYCMVEEHEFVVEEHICVETSSGSDSTVKISEVDVTEEKESEGPER